MGWLEFSYKGIENAARDFRRLSPDRHGAFFEMCFDIRTHWLRGGRDWSIWRSGDGEAVYAWERDGLTVLYCRTGHDLDWVTVTVLLVAEAEYSSEFLEEAGRQRLTSFLDLKG